MGNSLGRDIVVGEEVVVHSHIPPARESEECRIFVCEEGFGLLHDSTGRKISGYWKHIGPKDGDSVIYGYWINKPATVKHQDKLIAHLLQEHQVSIDERDDIHAACLSAGGGDPESLQVVKNWLAEKGEIR